MVQCLRAWLKRRVIAGVGWLLPLVAAAAAHGQMLRGPNLGVWFNQVRDASGTNALVVADLLDDGVFAQAGLREGDRIVSINGRPIDREVKFVDTLVSLGSHDFTLVVARNDQQLAVTLRASTVMEGMVAVDPVYAAGLMVDEGNPDSITVQRVYPCTPAFYAGLRQADIIASISDQPITSPADLKKALRAGGNLSVLVTRNGQPRKMMMSVGTDRSSRTVLRVPAQGGPLIPGVVQPPPPIVPNDRTLSAPPLLFPPTIPSRQPAVPSPPPAVPSPPPPGTVPTIPRI